MDRLAEEVGVDGVDVRSETLESLIVEGFAFVFLGASFAGLQHDIVDDLETADPEVFAGLDGVLAGVADGSARFGL